MLHEFREVRQIPNEGYRRWFTDDNLDLYVWYTDERAESITGFQLCYHKKGRQKALTWNRGKGFLHTGVDEGEDSPIKNLTPILVADGSFAKKEVMQSFRDAALRIEPELVDFVLSTIGRYPGE